jgi:hypothetical protein
MTNSRDFLGDFTQLPESTARAIVADADCLAFLEPRAQADDPSVRVTHIDDYQPEASDDHSKLYRFGDVFIAFELKGDSVSEVIAFHEDNLQEYVDTVFVNESKRFVVTSAAGYEEIESVIS